MAYYYNYAPETKQYEFVHEFKNILYSQYPSINKKGIQAIGLDFTPNIQIMAFAEFRNAHIYDLKTQKKIHSY